MDFYIGQVSYFTYQFVPDGWLLCDGSTLAIRGNETLYSLLGTRFGGDGRTVFNLPNLMGSVAAHNSNGLPLGATVGNNTVSLQANNMPGHNHGTVIQATGNPLTDKLSAPSVNSGVARVTYAPAGATQAGVLATFARTGVLDAAFSSAAISSTGASQAHENRQPFITMVPAICVLGMYPVRPD